MNDETYPESLYDYDNEDEESEPYLYEPEEIEKPVIPFYGNTTNASTYTWKIPAVKEKKVDSIEKKEVETKIPFYSETTHRSQYVAFDQAPVRRTLLSRRQNQITPTQEQAVPIEMETTYRNLYNAPTFGKREKTIQACPAEKIIHQYTVLRKARRENGHFFLQCSDNPTPLSKSINKNNNEDQINNQ